MKKEKKIYLVPEARVRINELQTYMVDISDNYKDDGDPLTDQDFDWDPAKERKEVGDSSIW